jgi:predicted kinase
MPHCTILVGLPASGKSTYVLSENISYCWDAEVISTDKIIDNITYMYNMTYNEGFTNLIKFAEQAMLRHLELSIERGYDVVVDRTNLTLQSRKRFIDIVKAAGYTVEAIVFPKPDDVEWNRRLNSREGKNIPLEALDRMKALYVEPSFAEGFDVITFKDAE